LAVRIVSKKHMNASEVQEDHDQHTATTD
jgi:hypothetical protein